MFSGAVRICRAVPQFRRDLYLSNAIDFFLKTCSIIRKN